MAWYRPRWLGLVLAAAFPWGPGGAGADPGPRGGRVFETAGRAVELVARGDGVGVFPPAGVGLPGTLRVRFGEGREAVARVVEEPARPGHPGHLGAALDLAAAAGTSIRFSLTLTRGRGTLRWVGELAVAAGPGPAVPLPVAIPESYPPGHPARPDPGSVRPHELPSLPVLDWVGEDFSKLPAEPPTWAAPVAGGHGGHGSHGGKAEAAAPAVLVCPMHPEIVRSEPGRCPRCGMELVPEAGP